jgi:glycogen(starch) synthase
MLGWEFPPRISGGLGVACDGLVRGLLRTGTEVALVLPRGAPRSWSARLAIVDAFSAGVSRQTRSSGLDASGRTGERHPPPEDRPSPAYAAPRPYRRGARRARPGGRQESRRLPPVYGADLVTDVLRYAEGAGRIASRQRFDVIHAHDWLTYLGGLEARRVSGKPLVVHVHATELDRSGNLDNRFVADIEALGVRRADRVIAVSRFTAARVAEVYGVALQRIAVVHNAIDARGARRTGRLRRLPLALFAGRLTRQKGPGFFLQAAALVAREVPRARFIMAGAGDLQEAAIAQASALGLRRRVLFPGFLPPRQLDRLYAEADVFVLPSVSEPFGLAVLEALAHGTPAIVARGAGVSEVVRNVLEVDFGDVEDLASKIVAVLTSQRVARRFAARGREEVRRLSWKSAAQRCLEIYRDLLALPPRAILEPQGRSGR